MSSVRLTARMVSFNGECLVPCSSLSGNKILQKSRVLQGRRGAGAMILVNVFLHKETCFVEFLRRVFPKDCLLFHWSSKKFNEFLDDADQVGGLVIRVVS